MKFLPQQPSNNWRGPYYFKIPDEENQPVKKIAIFKRFSGRYEKFIATYF